MPRSLRPRTSNVQDLSFRPYPKPESSVRVSAMGRTTARTQRAANAQPSEPGRRQTRTSAQWPPEDDLMVQELFRQGHRWSDVAQRMGRTQDACRQRHKRIKKQFLAENLDAEAIVSAYDRLRADFWANVAVAAGVERGNHAENLVMRLSLVEINRIASRSNENGSDEDDGSDDNKDDIDLHPLKEEPAQTPRDSEDGRGKMRISALVFPSPPAAEMVSEPHAVHRNDNRHTYEPNPRPHSDARQRHYRTR